MKHLSQEDAEFVYIRFCHTGRRRVRLKHLGVMFYSDIDGAIVCRAEGIDNAFERVPGNVQPPISIAGIKKAYDLYIEHLVVNAAEQL